LAIVHRPCDLDLPRNCGFFLPGEVVSSGLVDVDIDFWLRQGGMGWQWTFRLSNSDWQTLAEVAMQIDGTLRVTDENGPEGSLGSLPLGQPVSLRMALDLDGAVYSVWLDGVEKITDSPLTNSSLNFYRVNILTGWDSDPDNVFWIDHIRVQDTLEEVPVKWTLWGGIKELHDS
jgi:hypothetical protein